MKVAITAANGHLGSEIIKAIIELVGRDKVVGLARTPSKAEHLGVEIRPGDYNDKDTIQNSLKGVDTVLLVSGMGAPEKRITPHRNVIKAAKEAGVKKFVYTSVQGPEANTDFSPVVKSNRQTEEDIRNSGMDWVIGRNGIYIEPDLEYIENYKNIGVIANCAGDGKCGYTTRPELAVAYTKMLTENIHNGNTYNLNGEPITQQKLAEYLNKTFGTKLEYKSMSVNEYREERVAELGEFLGSVIAGIYHGIKIGAYENENDFSKAAGRDHQSWEEYFNSVSSKYI